MIKNVEIKGLATSPSDYACSDGEFAMCHNLVNDGGELKSVMKPEGAFKLPAGFVLKYVHSTTTKTMYIIGKTSSNELFYVEAGSESYDGEESFDKLNIETENGRCDSILSVGNVLIAHYDGNTGSSSSADDSIVYYRYKNGSYIAIGGGLPSLPKIRFGLHNLRIAGLEGLTDHIKEEYPGIEKTIDNNKFAFLPYHVDRNGFSIQDKEKNESLYNDCMSRFSRFHSAVSEAGGFTEPFLLRYAYRTYDGEIVGASPAILMLPSEINRPVYIMNKSDDSCTVVPYYGIASFLYYNLYDNIDLSDWEDVIESVVVMASSPIYRYKNNDYDSWRSYFDACGYRTTDDKSMKGYFGLRLDILPERFKNYTVFGAFTELLPPIVGTDVGEGPSPQGPSNDLPNSAEISPVHFKRFNHSINELQDYPEYNTTAYRSFYFVPEYKSTSEMAEELCDVSSFYTIAEIPIKDLSYSVNFKKLKIKKNALVNIEAGEVYKEDYLTNYPLVPSVIGTYNSRLLVSNYKRIYRSNFEFGTTRPYFHEYVTERNYKCFVKIVVDGEEFLIDAGSHSGSIWTPWLFYPDPNAREYIINPAVEGREKTYSIPLRKHDILQGAVWVEGHKMYDNSGWEEIELSEHIESKYKATYSSSILVSNVNNPFFLPSGNVARVGNARVITFVATTLPISEGQQGQFPVMAFTTEGIWALQISSEGSVIATNPMLRDVLIDKDSICVTEDGVVYATSQGIKLLRGKDSVCITDDLSGSVFNFENLQYFSTHSGLGDISTKMDIGRPSTWVKGCRMAYAPSLRRLYVVGGNEGWPDGVALVYNLDTRMWSTAEYPYQSPVNIYPTTYVQKHETNSTNIYDIDSETDAVLAPAVAVTRPIAFGAPDVFKTVRKTSVRGVFNYGDIKTILYGSYNNISWKPVASSKVHHIKGISGSPYKTFRLMMIMNGSIEREHAISGIDFDVIEKYNNKIR